MGNADVAPLTPECILASANPWSELLHAEVAHLLDQAGVRTLHIKGPTVVTWLYGEEPRNYGDVDILVDPAGVDRALAATLEHGWRYRYRDVDHWVTGDHATTIERIDALGESTGEEIDVHLRFEGIDLDPVAAFEILWRRREPITLGHHEVWAPDLTSRAILIILNVGRMASEGSIKDLALLIDRLTDPDWREVVALARRLEALPALTVGLMQSPEGAECAHRYLDESLISPQWRLRQEHAPRTALRLEEFSRIPWSQRPGILARWVVPHPAVMRMRNPAALTNPQLAKAYFARWGEGLRGLPASLRQVHRARHPRSDSDRPGGAQ